MERIETTLNVESKDPLEEEVRKIFEWSSEDGLGEHNFFRIVTDNFSESLKQLFLEKGYQIFYFNDVDVAIEKERLQGLLVSAQSIRDRKSANDKVVLVVSKKARKQVGLDRKTQSEWRLHSQYIVSLGDE